MKEEEFDILLVCHEKDKEILKKSIRSIKKNVVGYRKIFLLSKENFCPNDKEVNFVNENIFPFNKEEIGKYAPKGRAGWYYQQFLTLYFIDVMGDQVLDNVLAINSDVVFVRKVKFFDNGKPLYNFEVGYHEPYYEILEKIFGFGKQNLRLSGTTHHMMYQRKYMDEILNFKFKTKGTELWKEIMNNIDTGTESGLSEQDLYFNYVLRYHPNKVKIRKIKFVDFPYNGPFWRSLFRMFGYTYIASHEYLTRQKFPALRSIGIEILKLVHLKRFLKEMLLKSGLAKRK